MFTITIFSQYFYKHTPKQIFEIDFELNLLPTTMWSDFFRHYSQRGARSEHYFLIKSALIEWKQTLHTKIYPFIGNINSRKILNFVHLRRHNSSGPDKQVSAWNNGRSAGSDLEVKKIISRLFFKGLFNSGTKNGDPGGQSFRDIVSRWIFCKVWKSKDKREKASLTPDH